MSRNKIRIIPTEQDKMAGTIAALRRELPKLKEYAQIKAEMGRAYYDALLAEGFTPEEALYLVAAQVEAE